MWGMGFDLQTELELTLVRVLGWFYTQMGRPGVILCALATLGVGAWLVTWQMQNQGKSRVLKVYSAVIALTFVLHFFILPNTEQPAGAIVPSVSASAAVAAATSTPTAKANPGYADLPAEETIKLERLSDKLAGQKNTALRLPVTTAADNEPEEEQDWLHQNGKKLACWALLIAIILYLLRTKPEWLSLTSLSRLVQGSKAWIRPQRSANNELGSSDLATFAQIKRWFKPTGKYDTRLEVTDLRGATGIVLKKGELVFPSGERNRHMLIVAKTGGGKTTKMILPILYNDCLCPDRSTIVIDSKQEMWPKLAGMTRKHNPHKKLLLFNPLDRQRSLSWNILSKIESDTDCKLIANSVIMATDEPAAKADSPFFRNSALQILNALMVGLLHDPDETLSMPRIHELFNQGMHSLCDWLEAHPLAIRTTKSFVELARSGSQNADTIMSELSMRLQAWDLTAIRATTSQNEIDVEQLVKEPTLFVIELRESELKMLRPLANVIVVELLRYLTKYAEECPGQTLPRPVGLVCDEFASALGRLPDIHIKLNTLRSRNVSIVAAIQSIGQIKGNYGEDWESVISGFGTKIFMPTLDYMDSEWASKESGQMTVRYRTSSKGSNRKITENFANRNMGSNEYVQQRQVLTPAEVGRPVDNQATFFLPETPVFQGHLTPYYKIPQMHKAIDEFSSPDHEVKLREAPIVHEEKLPEAIIRKEGESGANGAGEQQFSDEQLWTALEEVKVKYLDWENTVGDARQWWLAFEEENKHRIALVLKVAQEIQKRGATVTDFFLAYVYSNTDNIQATLAYLDYTMHMKTAAQASS
jgi:type IV secretory pathway TraG/TraD family ATPase VirD4